MFDIFDIVHPYFELQFAVEAGDITHVKHVILERKDFLNEVCLGDDQTPLAYACMLGYLDIVIFLVEQGADVNIRMGDDGYTALFWAVMGGQIECVKFLVESGAKINIQSYQGDIVFDMAHYEDDDVDLTEIHEYLQKQMGNKPFSFEV